MTVDPARIKAVNEIYSVLSIIDENAEDVASDLEIACYMRAMEIATECRIPITFKNAQFISEYSILLHKVLTMVGLSLGADYDICTGVITGDISPDDIVRKSADELLPEINADLRDTIRRRAEASIKNKISRAYKCKDCGKNKTTYETKQIAAGDEGGTLCIKCLNCGNRWTKR